ncbi:hypothetical protein [Actinomadura sp. SCN-SB]|uniref:hypothetical protein n=1 Tax=Actinomadura sp. SCN-SB TaxID=3373092 RepID=UPI003750BC35
MVDTGCALRVPYAMTSSRPDRVTCLPCREYACDEHVRLTEWVERLGTMPGSAIEPDQARQAVRTHRDLAARFTTEPG